MNFFLRYENSLFFYDFTIHELKLIVEYNGSAFHPNKEKLSEEEWSSWKGLFSNKPADILYSYDNLKKEIANLHGYDVIIIWDTDDVNESINKIIDIIEEKNERNIKNR